MIEGMEQNEAIAALATLRSNNPDDVRFLAEVIDGVSTSLHPMFAAALVDKGLMIPTNIFIRLAIWITKKRKRSVYDLMLRSFNKAPDAATGLVEQTANHVLFGKDLTEEHSVGGFNQSEIVQVARIVFALAGLTEMEKA